nr:antimicrobial peptide NK-lysin isoform X2 [Taeniopygia guttata]
MSGRISGSGLSLPPHTWWDFPEGRGWGAEPPHVPPRNPFLRGGAVRQEGPCGAAVLGSVGFGVLVPHPPGLYKRCGAAGRHPLSVICCGLAMAATFLLLLLLLAAEATVPLPCQGDPASWCWDTATATRCGWEQQCQHLRDSLALGNASDGDRDSMGQSRGIKCSLCTKVLKKIQSLAGDDPDESAVAEAMRKGCRALGRAVGKVCKRLVKKYQDKISEALQNGDTPQDICTAMGICRS